MPRRWYPYGDRGRLMERKLEQFFALTPEERAWKFRLAHRKHGLPEPNIPLTEPLPEKIPWKFRGDRGGAPPEDPGPAAPEPIPPPARPRRWKFSDD
jgi:hypothetical protein